LGFLIDPIGKKGRKEAGIISQVVPAGGIGGGVVKFGLGAGKAVGRFFFGTPRRAITTAAFAPVGAGLLATETGQKLISPVGRFKFTKGTVQEFEQKGFFGTIGGLFGFDGAPKIAPDLIARQQAAARETRGFFGGDTITNIFGAAAPLALGAGLGAGLTALALSLRQRTAGGLAPPVLSGLDKPIGAVEPPVTAEPTVSPQDILPRINIKVRPEINVKVVAKPQTINILQASG